MHTNQKCVTFVGNLGENVLEEARISILKQALIAANGNRSVAAKMLGVTRQTIHRMIIQYCKTDAALQRYVEEKINKKK